MIESAINHGIDKVICLSTDKAVYPINAMGMSKALMEKLAISKSEPECDFGLRYAVRKCTGFTRLGRPFIPQTNS